MKTIINGTEFIIGEFKDGWGWTTKDDESKGCFESACQAQQDALRYASDQTENDDEPEDDNYQAEVSAFWNRRDYL